MRAILQSLQDGEITVSRAKEYLEAVEAGTFTLDWLPPAEAYFGEDLPIDVCKRLKELLRRCLPEVGPTLMDDIENEI